MRLGPTLKLERVISVYSLFAQLEDALFRGYPHAYNPARATQCTYAALGLPTHPGVMLVEVAHADAPPVHALVNTDIVVYVTGQPEDLYRLNRQVAPTLGNDEDRQVYVRLWLEIARGRKGWRLVETPADIAWAGSREDDGFEASSLNLRPLTLGEPDDLSRREATVSIQTAGAILLRHMILWPDGTVQVDYDETLTTHPDLLAPEPLSPFSTLRATTAAAHPEPAVSGALRTLEGLASLLDVDDIFDIDTDIDDAPDRTRQAPTPDPGWNLVTMFEKLAALLLTRALKSFRISGGEGHGDAGFFRYLTDYRPTVVIETPYRELRDDLARLTGRRVNLPVSFAALRGGGIPDPAAVVILTESTFNVAEASKDELVERLAPIVRGPHIVLLIVERKDALPQSVRDLIDFNLRIPRMDGPTFWAASGALFDRKLRPRQADWIGYALPRDMVRCAAATRDPRRYFAQLEGTIRRRLVQYTIPDAPSINDLHGLGEARYRIEELASDVKSALSGTLSWDQVDRGYLLVGPPGTGKTTLIKALAKECGVRFILASAGSWQEHETLGPHITAIRSTFREARLYAPAILFIDEIDSLGSRTRTESNNSQYQTVVINTVLEELQGFEGREGVIVIGATNNLDNVDEALRRPGRLDRIVEVPYPNVAALAGIYTYYIDRAARDGVTSENINVQRLAQLTFGRTGSHVELYVRGAARRAKRRGGKKLIEQDIIDEITARPPEGLGQPVTAEVMHRTAVHEAGHALISMTGTDSGRDLTLVSIVPRANGSLGFVARAPSELGVLTRESMEETVRVIFGGRAAEELVFGHDNISGGSGGSAGSDLAIATQLVILLLTQFGFSKAGGLLWMEWRGRGTGAELTAEAIRNLPMGEQILHEARRTTDQLYADALARLRRHRELLDRIVTALIDRQELSNQELKALLNPDQEESF